MKEFFLVFDEFNDKVVQSVSGMAMVAMAGSPDDVDHYYHVINENNHTHCIQFDWHGSLATLPEDKRWLKIPMYIMLDKMGKFRDIVPKFNFIRELNPRIFLRSDQNAVAQNLQLLSSLGINCGIKFIAGKVDWNSLNDLMHYAVYGKVQHATIEPFDYLLREYNSNQQTDFNMIWFDNPSKYLHVNKDGKVALTSDDLKKGNFILDSLSELEKLENMDLYKSWFIRWQEIFLENETCAFCPAWRICLGKFKDNIASDPGCKELFSEVMDAIDFVNETKNIREHKELCRP